MKRLIILLLLVALLLSATSCQGNKITSLPSDTISESANRMQISMGFWDIQSMENASGKDAVWQMIEDKFDIEVQPINLNWSDYNERYLIMAISGSLPDIFAATTTSVTSGDNVLQMSDMLARDLLRPLPEDLSAYPLVEKTVNELRDFITYEDGNIYAFPRKSFEEPELASSDAGMLVRKDWLENLGLGKPETLEDFIAMAAAFANDDPDGNGIDDTIGYNCNNQLVLGKWLSLGIAPECNIYSWIDYDGRFIPTYLHPEYQNVVTALWKLYQEGGLDPEFYQKKANDAVYDFGRGTLGALEYKVSPATIAEAEMYWNKYHDETEKFSDHVTYLNIFPAPDGKRYSNSSSVFWSETLISASVSDEKLDKILQLYDYLLSDDGLTLIRIGLEGSDYIVENSEYKSLLDTSEDNVSSLLTTKYPSLYLFTSLASWGGSEMDFFVSPENNLRYGETSMTIAQESYLWNKENTQLVRRPIEFLHMIKTDHEEFNSKSFADKLAQVIVSEDDPITSWQHVIAEWQEAGLNEYIENINHMASSSGIKPK
jgi:ABC-type glycerol-3-phosphate transport system substrate-binding protein